jgi:hypothetical protein
MSSTDYSFTVIDGSNFMCNEHSCSVEGDIKLLTNFKDGQMTIGSRDRSNQKWVLCLVNSLVSLVQKWITLYMQK